ncbi:MAG: MarR family transcriptional regulator [Legionellales bacterium]|nr:MarR family transcriptional regulator [Legionellales bacterium]
MQPFNTRDVNQQCSCFNLRKAARAVTQSFDHALEPMGIRATQFTLLVTMASVSARTLTEMASVLVMDRTTLTRNLKPLEKLGLIETVTPRDKRSKAYALTEKGREVLARSIPVWEKAQTSLVTEMGNERFNGLLGDLDAITKLVTKADK